ncbi:MAG TPA: DUF6024 family protein [Burkholderiaceae bacterium]|nr:DUF6024 family protein [Burkholderiaceae bacterium]
MDQASIAPIFQHPGAGNVFRDAQKLRDELRARLIAAYRLQQFSLCLVPSVTHGLLALAQLLASHGRRVALAPGSHYAPIGQLFAPLAHRAQTDAAAPDALITTHVCPYTGAVRRLSRHRPPFELVELVDASHSFATNLHDELIASADVFVAPLHKHAALAVGLALVAVRHDLAAGAPYALLPLLEPSTASQAPLIQALGHLDTSGPLRFNRAAIGAVLAPQAGPSLVRVSGPGAPLPFACFRHPLFARLGKDALRHAGATYFPQFDTLRIARWSRGALADPPFDFAPEVQATFHHLFQTT